MPKLTMTQDEMRANLSLRFCCVCGKPFAKNEKPTRQHVPPRSVFAVEDQDPLLVLRAHDSGNQKQSVDDEVIGQLVSVLHDRYPAEERLRIAMDLFSVDGSVLPMVGVKDLPLTRIIFGWVRCFHATLYCKYLVDGGGFIGPPFPESEPDGNGGATPEPVHVSRYSMTHILKQQAKIGRADEVVCFNGKCYYRCTWLKMDNGKEFLLVRITAPHMVVAGNERRYYKRIPMAKAMMNHDEIRRSFLFSESEEEQVLRQHILHRDSLQRIAGKTYWTSVLDFFPMPADPDSIETSYAEIGRVLGNISPFGRGYSHRRIVFDGLCLSHHPAVEVRIQ